LGEIIGKRTDLEKREKEENKGEKSNFPSSFPLRKKLLLYTRKQYLPHG
jgi:hypothetical protein